MDERFRREVSEFVLCFTCERCAHFDLPAQRCAHEYPSEPHRQRPLQAALEVVFCKEFELE